MGKVSVILGAIGVASSVLAIDIPAVPTWGSGSCTDKSLTIPSWIISKYKVVGGVTTFHIDNRAADPTGLSADMKCNAKGKCQGTGNDELRASISTESGTPVVTLSEVWVCSDAGDK